VPGQQFEYGFDDIGNRTTAKWGGDAGGSSASLRSATYTPTPTNTYSSRTVPGGFDVLGLANNAASVTVNSSPSDYRRGEYFQEAVSVSNGSVPVWQQISVTATNSGSSSNWPAGYVLVPKTAENFTYDRDGNLTSDGRFNYTWDGEGRLKQVESLATGPTASKRRVVWEYDGQGRRIRQTIYSGASGSYIVTSDLKLLNDGWRCVAELNASNNALVRSYTWGLDLSGSMDGAGGVGGLLLTRNADLGTRNFVAYDGNGNVVALVNAGDGTVTANYEYDPFGQTIRMSGPAAKDNPWRFSTKRVDNETDLVWYEYRAYSPSLGRFVSRDPLEEVGGVSLYGFVGNNSVLNVDWLGLEWTIQRDPGEPRATAIPGEGDTIRDLAKQLRLSTRMWQIWLECQTCFPGLGLDTKLSTCARFSVPNTVFIDVGYRFQPPDRWWDMGWWLLSLYDHTLNPNFWDAEFAALTAAAPLGAMGYHVEWMVGASAADIRAHLRSRNITGYIFGGHGAGGDINTPQKDDYVQAGAYTLYGISFMWLIACDTAVPEALKRWPANVAESGTFIGYTGRINILNRDDLRKPVPGTVP
jgi:RHS repeat-associated protein